MRRWLLAPRKRELDNNNEVSKVRKCSEVEGVSLLQTGGCVDFCRREEECKGGGSNYAIWSIFN